MVEKLLHRVASFSKCIKLVYTDLEYPHRTNNCRLWWNTPLEIPSKTYQVNNFAVIKNPIAEMKSFDFFPILEVETQGVRHFNNRVVYIGELSPPIEDFSLNLWKVFGDQFMLDLSLIRKKEFWEVLDLEDDDKFKAYIDLQNCIRLASIQRINHDLRKNLTVIGSGWENSGFESQINVQQRPQRQSLYRDSVCLDLGSKSGSNSLYQRSIEVIESGGILLQSAHPDSIEIYGKELASLITFSSILEMNTKIKNTLESDDLKSQILQLLAMRFSQPNSHYFAQFSKLCK
jgi:hypothetical protein